LRSRKALVLTGFSGSKTREPSFIVFLTSAESEGSRVEKNWVVLYLKTSEF
jgi:hypothetical protein